MRLGQSDSPVTDFFRLLVSASLWTASFSVLRVHSGHQILVPRRHTDIFPAFVWFSAVVLTDDLEVETDKCGFQNNFKKGRRPNLNIIGR